MNRRLVLVAMLFVAGVAQGALYQFQVKATVYFSSVPYPSFGDEILMIYSADSTDLEPAPLGRYAATSAMIFTPGGPYFPVETAASEMTVAAPGAFSDTVGYGTRVQFPAFASYDRCPLVMTLSYPRGFLQDASLPITLPLSSANLGLLEIFPAPFFDLRVFSARVTSYEGSLVPEPASSTSVLLGGCAMIARRRAPRPRV